MLLVPDHTFRPGLAEPQNLQSKCEKEHGISLRNRGTSPDLPLTHCVGRKVQYWSRPVCLPGKRNHVSLVSGSNGKEPTCQHRRHKKHGFNPWEDPLEEEMATHSSILAWKIPWAEEPGRLQSLWLQKSGT